MHRRLLFLLTAFAISPLLPKSVCAQQANGDLAGAPLAHARQTAIDARAFHRELDAEKIAKWIEIASVCTMAEFELFLAPLTDDEQKLVEKLATMPAPIVNRLHFEDLRAVLKAGQLSSYYVEEELGKHLAHTTPAIEDKLYGAFDCVFASVGPPDGSPRYGDVVIRMEDSVRDGAWATPFSGMHFIYAVRHQDARKMQDLLAAGKNLPTDPTNPLSLGFDDRLHFSHYVVTERHWNRALAYQAILVLRNAGDTAAGTRIRQRFAKLLSEDDPRKFWKTFIPAREENLSEQQQAARTPFGYLEGKFDNRLTTAQMTSIEVPADKLKEVLTWPEAQPHRHLIRAKANDVP
ncbi:hypothetical protein NG895_22515 [Aeoliella sp. ICT_H6.2]|uniref:Uncharacterized protein n=1 Tax=Aeoliella straminimaris TaxID=2954799 RepID=A0A9X2JKJ3_9BACT|nr:hypothetical protein [Aeoliella straminimaris]MCO6046679.1 hypothetical protein [Aeoliella straminimaris]